MNASKPPLDEREFELVNIVGAELAANQRELSRHMNLSLGMTNMLLRRLITKGYIRIKQLNRRKVEYFLTPKGFAEKMRKSVRYTLKTIHSIGLIKKQLLQILNGLQQKGRNKFYVLGKSDLTGLLEMTAKEHLDGVCKIIRIDKMPDGDVDGVILICQEDAPAFSGQGPCINLIEELAKMEI